MQGFTIAVGLPIEFWLKSVYLDCNQRFYRFFVEKVTLIIYKPGLMPNERICESDDNGFDNSDWCNNEKFVDSSLSAVETRFSVAHSVPKNECWLMTNLSKLVQTIYSLAYIGIDLRT